jgi:predicted RecB family endonuclease
MEKHIMSALDDLKAALTALVNEAVTDLEAVIAKLAATPPDDTAAIQALTQQATDTTAKLKADMAAIAMPPPTTTP